MITDNREQQETFPHSAISGEEVEEKINTVQTTNNDEVVPPARSSSPAHDVEAPQQPKLIKVCVRSFHPDDFNFEYKWVLNGKIVEKDGLSTANYYDVLGPDSDEEISEDESPIEHIVSSIKVQRRKKNVEFDGKRPEVVISPHNSRPSKVSVPSVDSAIPHAKALVVEGEIPPLVKEVTCLYCDSSILVYSDYYVFLSMCSCSQDGVGRAYDTHGQLCDVYYDDDVETDSQINGNNGEWTNTDDFPTQNDVNKRLNKESKTNRHRAGGSNKKGMGNGPLPECKYGDACPYSNCKYRHGNPDPLDEDSDLDSISLSNYSSDLKSSANATTINTPVIKVHLIGNHRGRLYIWSENTGTGSSIEPITEEEGDKHRYAVLGHYDNDGLFDDLDITLYGVSPVTLFKQSLYIPDFVSMGIAFQVRRSLTFSPLLFDEIIRELPLPTLSEKNFSAIQRFLLKKHPMCPREIIIDTSILYAYDLRKTKTEVLSLTDARELAFSAGAVTSFEKVELDYPVNNVQFKNDWEFNRRWRILARSGMDIKIKKNLMLEYPTFKTLYNDKPKYLTWKFCAIEGGNPFARYEVNGYNCTGALSRQFKAREDEDEYFVNAMSHLNLFPERYDLYPIVGVSESFSYRNSIGAISIDYTFARTERTVQVPVLVDDLVTTCLEHYASYFHYGLWDYFLNYVQSTGIAFYNATSRTYETIKTCFWSVIAYVYSPIFFAYCYYSWLSVVVQLPHPKRLYYQSCFKNYYDDISDNSFTWELKIKKELGKYKKAARLYGSAGPNALYNKIGPEIMKCGFKTIFRVEEHYTVPFKFSIYFSASQEAGESDDMYRRLQELEEGEVVCIYFSDDGFICHRIDGVTHLYETDISGCDASQTLPIFVICYKWLAQLIGRSTALQLVRQCSYVAKIRNPSNPAEFLNIQPETFFEYSGSVLTTVLNNIASILIFLHLAALLNATGGDAFSELISTAGKNAGYKLTVEEHQSWNAITFLKRAFNGKRSWVVYGTLLRSLGMVDHMTPEQFGLDYPTFYSKTPGELFELHLVQRAMSLVNEPASCIINALLTRVGLPQRAEEITIMDLQERYGCEEHDYYDFCHKLTFIQLGDMIITPLTKAIMHKDYGVEKERVHSP